MTAFSILVLVIAVCIAAYGTWKQQVLGVTAGVGIAIMALKKLAGVPYLDDSPASMVLDWLSTGLVALNGVIVARYIWQRRQLQRHHREAEDGRTQGTQS